MAGAPSYPVVYTAARLVFTVPTWVSFVDPMGTLHNVVVNVAGSDLDVPRSVLDGKATVQRVQAFASGQYDAAIVTFQDTMLVDSLSRNELAKGARLEGEAAEAFGIAPFVVAQIMFVGQGVNRDETVRMAQSGGLSIFTSPAPARAALDRIMETKVTMGEWELMKERVPELWDVLADLANYPEVTA